MSKKKPPLAQYLVLGMLFLAACTYQVRATIAWFPGFLQREAAKWPFYPGYSHGVLTLQFVGSEAKTAGIHEGDILIAITPQTRTYPANGPKWLEFLFAKSILSTVGGAAQAEITGSEIFKQPHVATCRIYINRQAPPIRRHNA